MEENPGNDAKTGRSLGTVSCGTEGGGGEVAALEESICQSYQVIWHFQKGEFREILETIGRSKAALDTLLNLYSSFVGAVWLREATWPKIWVTEWTKTTSRSLRYWMVLGRIWRSATVSRSRSWASNWWIPKGVQLDFEAQLLDKSTWLFWARRRG